MQRHKLSFIFLVFLVFGNAYLFTNEAQAMRDLTAKELKRLIDSGGPLFLLNPLSEIEFNEAHIEGSVNIPIEKIYDTKELPEDKSTMIVTYCLGPK